ncbi:MAG: N-acetylglucosamine-6-phosphate deacetylase [Phenylobacterium sp.]|uniref:N-acetylglucosamine-6-phosphate deacetylase n=1 Tax=Phenylobacterium sp. TaxID=1871053 RepID=UPI0025E3BF87|nr:N-acetylglucosamine-6-phosphate deacetylase [Phenylobacterium sp.]MBI1198593.1 N-acetylglucosamine-6-phosphate deacetylase [Phenylobacterium sp.]
MTSLRFVGGVVVGGGEGLLIVDGRVAAPSGRDAPTFDLEGGFLLPGFIDTQVNGGGGVLFNDDPTVEAIVAIGAAHRRFGTTAFLPTLISDDLDRVDMAMRAVEAAIEAGAPGVVGIHLEGPFLNAPRRGAHDASKFRRLDAAAIALLSSLRVGKTLVTLAPETCEAADIAALVRAGVVVAAGHTDATYRQAVEAFAGGVTGVTHLFNAMSPFSHRAPGVAGAALENRSVYCGLIADGRHVDPAALRVAVNARPRDRFMLVTDAMPGVGSASKSFTLQGRQIRVLDGVCVDDDGVLAGSNLDMATALRNMVAMAGVTLEEASVMASAAPAAFLGLADRGVLAPGARADLVWLDAARHVRGVWIGGRRVV